jgi:hypothetical protein
MPLKQNSTDEISRRRSKAMRLRIFLMNLQYDELSALKVAKQEQLDALTAELQQLRAKEAKCQADLAAKK